MSALRVMTYNIKGQAALWRPGHLSRVAKVIAEEGADVVGVQEVHRRSWQSRKRDQAAELAQHTGMRLAFGRAMGNSRSEYGNVILTRGEIVEQHVEPLPGEGEPRSLLAVTIAIDDIRLQAFVTHLSARGKQNRIAQAKAVAKRAELSELPFVLMGDFNARPTTEELRVFTEGGLVTSCFDADVITHRTTRRCLDYIFVDRRWKMVDARVVKRGPSDHWPLVAELERLA